MRLHASCRLNIAQPALSHHRKALAESGLVVERKEGKWTRYSLSEKGIELVDGHLNACKPPDAYAKKQLCCEAYSEIYDMAVFGL